MKRRSSTTKRSLIFVSLSAALLLASCATKSSPPMQLELMPTVSVPMPRKPNEILSGLRQSEANSELRRQKRLLLLTPGAIKSPTHPAQHPQPDQSNRKERP